MRTRHHERGQVLPVWCLGIVAMLVMVLMAVRYADIVRWQIRAQNAADAAAQAVLALQTQQFNEMNSVLYASAVEEYRIRSILYGLELTAYGNGGCSADSSCPARYAALYAGYLKAVARYREEIVLLNRITANMDSATMTERRPRARDTPRQSRASAERPAAATAPSPTSSWISARARRCSRCRRMRARSSRRRMVTT